MCGKVLQVHTGTSANFQYVSGCAGEQITAPSVQAELFSVGHGHIVTLGHQPGIKSHFRDNVIGSKLQMSLDETFDSVELITQFDDLVIVIDERVIHPGQPLFHHFDLFKCFLARGFVRFLSRGII